MKEVSRNELLKVWCEQDVERTSKLGILAFPHHSHPHLSVSNYKCEGNRKISDELWKTLVDKMQEIEADELYKKAREKENSDNYVTQSKLKIDHYAIYGWGRSIHDQSYDQLRQVNFIQTIRDWLNKDAVAKLRMIDLAYVVNYDDSKNKNYRETYVSNIIKKNNPVSIEDENRIYSLMTHIDKLIAERHVFYIASSLNTEATYY